MEGRVPSRPVRARRAVPFIVPLRRLLIRRPRPSHAVRTIQITAVRKRPTQPRVIDAIGGSVRVRPQTLGARQLCGFWFDPRTGQAIFIGQVESKAELEFCAPSAGRGNDWVLVLDDSACEYPPPGKGK